jgi:NitT/TauT family transport system ATP-binding protein
MPSAEPRLGRWPMVQLDDVSLLYGDDERQVLALEHCSFKIEEGSFVAVVGPSGCGKSTLMRVVTGLGPVSGGVVLVRNKEVNAPLSFVGMAFQNPNLLPWRSTLSNVMLPLEIVEPHASQLRRKRADYASQAMTLLKMAGLRGFEKQYPWQLSGGMQQRASLCRALVHEPSLLMLDEPFGALDMFTREELWLALQNLWLTRQNTVVLVTHDLREAVFLADRVLVMSSRPGRIVSDYQVELPRPRELSCLFSAYAGNLIRQLRDDISATRNTSNQHHDA